MHNINVSQLRNNLKEVLDQAEEGKTITIERNGTVFTLSKGVSVPEQELLTEDRIRFIVAQELEKLGGYAQNSQTSSVTPISPKTYRTKSDIKRDIDALEAERHTELEFIQDPETITSIHNNHQAKIDTLWKEFHEATNG
jgi:prevent-host-death family protein